MVKEWILMGKTLSMCGGDLLKTCQPQARGIVGSHGSQIHGPKDE